MSEITQLKVVWFRERDDGGGYDGFRFIDSVPTIKIDLDEFGKWKSTMRYVLSAPEHRNIADFLDQLNGVTK